MIARAGIWLPQTFALERGRKRVVVGNEVLPSRRSRSQIRRDSRGMKDLQFRRPENDEGAT